MYGDSVGPLQGSEMNPGTASPRVLHSKGLRLDPARRTRRQPDAWMHSEGCVNGDQHWALAVSPSKAIYVRYIRIQTEARFSAVRV